jgi:ribonuclease J
MREACADMGRALNMKEENIIVTDNGEVQEFDDTGKYIKSPVKVPTSFVLIDGLGVGDVGNIVLRDRQAMAEGGIFVIILTIDHKTMQIITSPDIISRGFVYMRAAEDLIRRSRQEVKNIFRRHAGQPQMDMAYVKTTIREELGEFLFNETKRRPMVIPVVIEV